MTDELHNNVHIATLRETILSNVRAYFNNEVPYLPQRNEETSVHNEFRNEYRRRMDERPFIEKLEEIYLSELQMYSNECQADRAVFDGFELDPIEYRNEVFKNCNYVSVGFKNKNPAITSPFYNIKGEPLIEKIKNIKAFIDSNIQKMQNNRDEAILDLAALAGEDYTWTCIDSRKQQNSNILGARCKSFLTTNDLYALFMLTARNGKVRPDNCEFVTYSESGNWANPNANYPYELFAYYAAAIFDEMKKIIEQKQEALQDMDTYKYVALEAFFKLVYESNGMQLAEIRTRPADRELYNRR